MRKFWKIVVCWIMRIIICDILGVSKGCYKSFMGCDDHRRHFVRNVITSNNAREHYLSPHVGFYVIPQWSIYIIHNSPVRYALFEFILANYNMHHGWYHKLIYNEHQNRLIDRHLAVIMIIIYFGRYWIL